MKGSIKGHALAMLKNSAERTPSSPSLLLRIDVALLESLMYRSVSIALQEPRSLRHSESHTTSAHFVKTEKLIDQNRPHSDSPHHRGNAGRVPEPVRYLPPKGQPVGWGFIRGILQELKKWLWRFELIRPRLSSRLGP